jgi:hypothetical protein
MTKPKAPNLSELEGFVPEKHKRNHCDCCGYEWTGLGAGTFGTRCPLPGCPGSATSARPPAR